MKKLLFLLFVPFHAIAAPQASYSTDVPPDTTNLELQVECDLNGTSIPVDSVPMTSPQVNFLLPDDAGGKVLYCRSRAFNTATATPSGWTVGVSVPVPHPIPSIPQNEKLIITLP